MGYQVKTIPYSLHIGNDFKWVPNLQQLIKENSALYDYIIVPLIHPRLFRSENSAKAPPWQLIRSDSLEITGANQTLARNIHGKISPSIDLESPVQHIRDRAEYCFIEELEMAEYLKIDGVVIEIPVYSAFFPDPKIDNLWRILNQYLPQYSLKVYIKVPLIVNPK